MKKRPGRPLVLTVPNGIGPIRRSWPIFRREWRAMKLISELGPKGTWERLCVDGKHVPLATLEREADKAIVHYVNRTRGVKA